MAITELYVDPSIAADSGSGTVGDPYGDLEYCLEQEDWDAVNGIRVNIKAGTDEVLAAKLETAMADTTAPGKSVAWVPTEEARMILEGYSSTAGDLQGTTTLAGISGGGSVPLFDDATVSYLTMRNIHAHNVGTNTSIVDLDNYITIVNCEFDNVTGNAITCDVNCSIRSNYIHNFTVRGILTSINCTVGYNYIDGQGASSYGIEANQGEVFRNIVICDGASSGINAPAESHVFNNAIYGVGAATGSGVHVGAGHVQLLIANNLIEGFSGSGGKGVNFVNASTSGVVDYYANSVYDCETAFTTPGIGPHYTTGNEELSQSPFVNAAGGNFAPVDTGSVKEGSLPDKVGGGLV